MGGGGKCANREWNCYKDFVRHNRVSLISERPRIDGTYTPYKHSSCPLCALDYFSESPRIDTT